MNAKLRAWAMVLLGLTVVGTLAGWMLGKDPLQLGGFYVLMGAVVAALEGGMVGKRATYKQEASRHE